MMSLNKDELVAEAFARTGLRDFGEDDFLDALDSQLKSTLSESKISPVGAAIDRGALVHYLCQHLRMEEYFKRYPEIDAQQVVAPLVILGLNRTGTTKLFRSMASDPQWNVVPHWEGISPIPMDDRLSAEEDREMRIAIGRGAVEMSEKTGLINAHYVAPFEAEEEGVTLLLQTFMSPPAWLHTPSHHRWCETADYVRYYRYLLRQLKFLQWTRGTPPGKRWLLKTPAHLDTLPELTQVFPDAVMVWTHRHPKIAVASMARTVELAYHIYTDDIDRPAMGRLWLRNMSRQIRRALQFRQDHPDFPILDLDFRDTVRDSLSVFSRIYAFAKAPMTDETVRAIAKWEEDNPKGKHGEHTYALEDYGLTDADIEREFGGYIGRYVSVTS